MDPTCRPKPTHHRTVDVRIIQHHGDCGIDGQQHAIRCVSQRRRLGEARLHGFNPLVGERLHAIMHLKAACPR